MIGHLAERVMKGPVFASPSPFPAADHQPIGVGDHLPSSKPRTPEQVQRLLPGICRPYRGLKTGPDLRGVAGLVHRPEDLRGEIAPEIGDTEPPTRLQDPGDLSGPDPPFPEKKAISPDILEKACFDMPEMDAVQKKAI